MTDISMNDDKDFETIPLEKSSDILKGKGRNAIEMTMGDKVLTVPDGQQTPDTASIEEGFSTTTSNEEDHSGEEMSAEAEAESVLTDDDEIKSEDNYKMSTESETPVCEATAEEAEASSMVGYIFSSLFSFGPSKGNETQIETPANVENIVTENNNEIDVESPVIKTDIIMSSNEDMTVEEEDVSSINVETMSAASENSIDVDETPDVDLKENDKTAIITSSNEDMTVEWLQPLWSTTVEAMATASDNKTDVPSEEIDALPCNKDEMVVKNEDEASTKNESTESNSKIDVESGDSMGTEEIDSLDSNNDDDSLDSNSNDMILKAKDFVGKARELLEDWQVMTNGQDEKGEESTTSHLTEQMLTKHDENQVHEEVHPINGYIPKPIPDDEDLELGQTTMMTKGVSSEITTSQHSNCFVILVTILILALCVVSAMAFLKLETLLN